MPLTAQARKLHRLEILRDISQKSWLLEILLGVTILSLFTGIRFGTAAAKPFDVLAALTVAVAMAQAKSWRDTRLSIGPAMLIPYFLCHSLSAFTVDYANGIRETIEVVLCFSLALAVALSIDRLNYARLGRMLLFGMIIITAYSIYWHLTHGFLTAWKRLNQPKATFTFLPLVLGVELAFFSIRERWRSWAFWLLFGAIILQSGERKALITFGILTVALVSKGRAMVAVMIVAAGVFGLSLAAASTDNPYLHRQFDSILNPFGYGSYSLARSADPDEAINNAQRFFAADLSKRLIAEHPFFGVGTNGYSDIIEEQFSYLPDYLQNSIHGEFLRIPTENGLVGLVFYLAIWAVAIFRTFTTLLHFRRTGLVSFAQVITLPIVFFAPCLFYLGFEATGTHSFVLIVLITLWPDILRSALPRYLKAHKAPNKSPAPSGARHSVRYPFVGAR